LGLDSGKGMSARTDLRARFCLGNDVGEKGRGYTGNKGKGFKGILKRAKRVGMGEIQLFSWRSKNL